MAAHVNHLANPPESATLCILARNRWVPAKMWHGTLSATMKEPTLGIGGTQVTRLAALCLGLAIVLAGSRPARADLVTFGFEQCVATSERFVHPGGYESLECSAGMITMIITRSDGAPFDVIEVTQPTFPHQWGTRALDPWFGWKTPTDNWFIASFSLPVSYVQLQFTDFGQDSDTVYLRAYSSLFGLGDFIGGATAPWGTASSPSFVTLEYTAPTDESFMSVMFRGYSPVLSNSMYVDNIAVQTIAIPEPASSSALSIGLGLMAARRRRWYRGVLRV